MERLTSRAGQWRPASMVRAWCAAAACVLALSAGHGRISAAADQERPDGPGADTIAALQHAFATPPDNAAPMMRWWWFGPSVTHDELEREMRAMKAGGIGGFEVQPVYPLALDDDAQGIRTLPFLSDDFIDAVRFVADRAQALGLRMDLTLGSGWPFGGPGVPIAAASAKLRIERRDVPPARAT